jgi:predicted Fe-Mo cluster-binding NifX family protein
MKIAFTTKGIEWDSKIDPRFGRTDFFLIYDQENNSFEHFDNRAIANDAHGAGPKTAQKLFELKAEALITGNGPGGNAASVLEKTGIKVFIGAGEMTVKEAYEAYNEDKLKAF